MDGNLNRPDSWPLAVRDIELEAARASMSDGRGLVVVGDAGTGKTRLASEVVAAESAGGGLWHTVVGSVGAAAVPLGAWSHLLPATWEPGDDDLDTWRSLARNLTIDGQPVHLFIDDAHWLDPVSAGLVHHLVTTGAAKALLTIRRDAGVSQPITALWKDGHLARLDLEPLDAAEVAAALELALDAPVEPRTAARFHERSGGNFLMLRELVDAGLADATLQLAHGAWVQQPTARPSARLVDLLADRLDGLSPTERAAAELVAVAQPVAADELAGAVDQPVLRRLVRARVIEIGPARDGGIVRCVHPLVGEVIVERMDPDRHEQVLRTLVDLFERSPATADADVVRTALWRLEVGLPLDGPAALRAAGLALERNGVALAVDLARVAVDAGEGPEAVVLLGEALQRQQRGAEADEVLAPLASRLDQLDPALRLRYAEARALALSREVGRLDDAVSILEATLATMPDGRPRWALEARLAFVLSDCRRLRAAEPLAEARMAAIAEDDRAALGAFTAFATCRSFSGRGRDALEACETILPIALAHLDEVPIGLGWVAAQRLLALYLLGELDEWAETCAFVEAMVVDDLDPTQRAALLTVQGLLASERGWLDEATRLLQQSAALHEIDDRRGYQAYAFVTLSRVHAQRGDIDAASHALDHARRTIWPDGQVYDLDLDTAAIWIAAGRGQRKEAERLLAAGIERADAEGMWVSSASLRHEAIRVGLPPEPHVAPLASFAEIDQGLRGSIWSAHAAALASDDGDQLVEVGRRFDELGTHLVAAEAFMQAAAAHHRAGRAASAARAKELGRQQLAQCPGARTPALFVDETVAGLTERELDIARRAAAGQTNRVIAEATGISVRTVETHLQRAFAKLGIHRRAELVDVLDVPIADR